MTDLLLALARSGFRGPIRERCLTDLANMAKDVGVEDVVAAVEADSGLTVIATDQGWFVKEWCEGWTRKW